MRKQRKGFAFLLFGILLVLMEYSDPWIPIIDDMPWSLLGLVAGIVGLILVLNGGKDE
ncbi:hypothetical protein [Agathobaculum sp. Marseille-P7918]|uniref:hypothetical protein n=1 Tax=Agathobaculum sp. Marseille-P7918 TaxID=2479843 RepID=UPI003568D8D8